jgi:hypothetical protein
LKLQQPGHSAECPASTCVHHLSVLANLPALISHVRSVELEPCSAGRPHAFVAVQSNLLSQQLSALLKKTSIHEVLEQMRAKCRAEVRDSSGPRHLAWGQEKAEEKSSESREGAIVALLFVPTHVDESKMMC